MRRKLRSPLPQRHGLDPVRLRTPAEGPWTSIRDHLVERLPRVAPGRIDQMLAEGRIVDLAGPVAPDAPFVPEHFLWFHRDLPEEVPVPFEIGIVHRDDDLLVVDKPHFLSTIPRGRHIVQTALVRLRRELDLPTLSPAHRLDRVTAGLLMFVIRPERRGAYQTLFRDRLVRKTYEAIAHHDPTLELPRTVRSRIVKQRGVITAQEVDGPPNAETLIELVEHRNPGADARSAGAALGADARSAGAALGADARSAGAALGADLGRYRLTPATGRTHQIRLHMSGLGIPILGDDFYPVLTETPLDDFSRPLQLLATTLEFRDPITGEQRRFHTRAKLAAWPGPVPDVGAPSTSRRTSDSTRE